MWWLGEKQQARSWGCHPPQTQNQIFLNTQDILSHNTHTQRCRNNHIQRRHGSWLPRNQRFYTKIKRFKRRRYISALIYILILRCLSLPVHYLQEISTQLQESSFGESRRSDLNGAYTSCLSRAKGWQHGPQKPAFAARHSRVPGGNHFEIR